MASSSATTAATASRADSAAAPAHNHSKATSPKEQGDPDLDVSLPYRTLAPGADMTEYTTETAQGSIPGPAVATGAAPAAPAAAAAEKRYRLVTFALDDKENPKNWSRAYKWYCTMVVALTCFVVALASSVVTADVAGVVDEFGCSQEVALLSISLFVVGFGVGPMVFAPLSELYGRRIIYGTTLFVAVVFIIPAAVAQNIETLLVARLIDGIAFSAPMTLVGGTLADLWRAEERGVPMAAFSAAPFIGPAIGPLVGGFLSDAAGWRWLYWIQLILAVIVWVLITFTVPETFAPTILARRARRLRRETGNAEYVTEQDLDTRPVSERLSVFMVRPFQLLFGELIVFLISIYMSILYGLLYAFFVAFPIVYQRGKGYSAGTTGLMFIPLAVGVLLSAACSPAVNKHYRGLVAKHNNDNNNNNRRAGSLPPPELRLVPMMASCWFIPAGVLIFAWTSYPHLSWAGPALGGLPVGFGFIFLYNSANNYLVDSYQHQAASALAAKTCIRSLCGAAVVLFTEQMYARLGDQWASTLVAGVALLCCAIPFLFWRYGARIRRRSKYAYAGGDDDDDDEQSLAEKNALAGSTATGMYHGQQLQQQRQLGVREDYSEDEDLRRARSYVSNP